MTNEELLFEFARELRNGGLHEVASNRAVELRAELLRRLGAAVSASPQISRIEWQAILDAMMFTENNVGLVSDAHIRVRRTVERKITDIDMGWNKSVSASPQPLELALRKIADSYGGCHCDHTNADCCEKAGEFCPHCISEIALAQFFAAAPAQEPLRPGRTKLLMKFWSAMHLAGFAKDKEWDAQEKIHIEDLVKLMTDSAAQEQPVENSPILQWLNDRVHER